MPSGYFTSYFNTTKKRKVSRKAKVKFLCNGNERFDSVNLKKCACGLTLHNWVWVPPLLPALVSFLSRKKTIHSRQSNIQWASDTTMNFQATCSSKVNSQQFNNTQSFTPKEDFKEILLLMSLRANQVYRHSHWSHISFKYQTDLKPPHGFQKEPFTLRSPFFGISLGLVISSKTS